MKKTDKNSLSMFSQETLDSLEMAEILGGVDNTGCTNIGCNTSCTNSCENQNGCTNEKCIVNTSNCDCVSNTGNCTDMTCIHP
ncbi:MAG: hypothetical protein II878_06425 [Bacteroidales bacterium]|nr:hypothetical protein [Bacteroidales bacterium]